MERERKPIKINRVPITKLTELNRNIGGWFPFPKPDVPAPFIRKLKRGEEVLWCPWCGDWEIFKKDNNTGLRECTGWCGWSNDNEFYVKTYNNLWL